jgi:hypothetical protein
MALCKGRGMAQYNEGTMSVLAQMSPSSFEQIMQGPEHPNLTSSGKLVVCGDSRQVCWAGGVLQEVALEPT